MNLFSDKSSNILPYDGMVQYQGKIFKASEAADYFNVLLNSIEWKNDEAMAFGKRIITNRKVAWYADQPFSYTYSGITKHALPWTRELIELKDTCERLTNSTFNSCLLNLYHNGDEGMAWHSDDEKTLAKNADIASLTFGAERKFSFKHKRSKEAVSLILENGSLLVMGEETQTNWMHRLPPTVKVKRPRINLTFRTILA